MALLITTDELSALLDSAEPIRVLDVRWRLDRPEGRPEYLQGHLPGAVYVDLEQELSRRGQPDEGRHPLPHRDRLQEAARRWGLNPGERVVVYDDVQSVAAARAWWLLTRSGAAEAGVHVQVLDGGLRAWVAAGGALATGDVQPAPGTITLIEPEQGIASLDEAAAWPRAGVLLDVRAPERYRGDLEPMDPIAGHIPGAVNLPTTVHLEAGRFRSPAQLRAAFASAGVDGSVPVAAYCGSGVTAAHTALAGALAGLEVTVFPGSWSQWSNTRGRPIARGATPSGNVHGS